MVDEPPVTLPGMNVTGWIGVGSLGVIGAGVGWTLLYNARLAWRRTAQNRRAVAATSTSQVRSR
jgi:hypothetical protein